MKKDISERLKDSIKPIYKKIFEENKLENVCTFCMQWGENYPNTNNKKLLFVGKAVNGWITDDQNVENMFDKNNPDRIFDREDQMEWVNNLSGNTEGGYNTKKSAFWRIIKEVAEKYYRDNWYSYIAWSNLYKIAPYEGGNPSEKLKKQQQQYCFDLLEKEIAILSPEYVIFLTSGWEQLFINQLKKEKNPNVLSKKQWGKGKFNTALLEIEGIKYITSPHPQGKKEREHTDVITELINEN